MMLRSGRNNENNSGFLSGTCSRFVKSIIIVTVLLVPVILLGSGALARDLGFGYGIHGYGMHGYVMPGGVISEVMTEGVRSYLDLRFKGICRQKLSTTCGPACVATLLNYYFGIPCSEWDIIESIIDYRYNDGKLFEEKFVEGKLDDGILNGEERVRSAAALLSVNLLDLKRYMSRKGVETEGLRLNLEQLRRLLVHTPLIVQEKNRNFHFTILLEITDDYVVKADPSLGLIVNTLEEFQSLWEGVALLPVKSKNPPDRSWRERLIKRVESRGEALEARFRALR